MRRILCAAVVVGLTGCGSGVHYTGKGATPAAIVVAARRWPRSWLQLYRLDLNGRRVALTHLAAGVSQPLVSPDRKRIAFISGSAVEIMDVGSRAIRRVARVPVSAALVAWSPNGREIAYADREDLTVISTDGAHVFDALGSLAWAKTGRAVSSFDTTISLLDPHGRRLATLTGRFPAWSPDGNLLANLDTDGNVVVRGGGGTGPVLVRVPSRKLERVARVDTSNSAIVWVSDRRLAVGAFSNVFLENEPSAVVDVRTGRVARGRPGTWFAAACGCANRTGTLVARPVERGSRFAIVVSRPDGTGVRTLETVPGCWSGETFWPAITPLHFAWDDRSIVYASECDEPSANLYRVTLSGRIHAVTTGSADRTEPAWSPDGKRIVYVYAQAPSFPCRACGLSLRLIDSDGTHGRALTGQFPGAETFDQYPSWSPDGRRIVFARSSPNDAPQLFIVAAKGGPARLLGLGGDRPSWGPRLIAYVLSGRRGESLWTVHPDGSGRRRISSRVGHIESPAWSRDGKLAYLQESSLERHPILVEIVRGKTRRIPLPVSTALRVTWSPDGRRLAVVGDGDVYVVAGNRLTRLTRGLEAVGADWSG